MHAKELTEQSSAAAIRIDGVTHVVVMSPAEELNTTMTGVIRDAVRLYRYRQLHNLAAQQLADLRKDPEAWDDFLGGEEHWPEFKDIPQERVN